MNPFLLGLIIGFVGAAIPLTVVLLAAKASFRRKWTAATNLVESLYQRIRRIERQ